MLLSLISLSDEDIESVMAAVSGWCRAHQFDVNSAQGRRALTVAVDIIQSMGESKSFNLLNELSKRLDAPSEVL